MDKISKNLSLTRSSIENILYNHENYLNISDTSQLLIIDNLKNINKFLLDIIIQCLIIPTEFTVTDETLTNIMFYAPLTLTDYEQIVQTSWTDFIHNLSYIDTFIIANKLDIQLNLCLKKYKENPKIEEADHKLFKLCNQLTVTLLNKIILENKEKVLKAKHEEQTLQIDTVMFNPQYKIKFKGKVIPFLNDLFRLIIPKIAVIIITSMTEDYIRSIAKEDDDKKNTDKKYKSILLLSASVNIMNSFAIFQIIEKMISSETDKKVLEQIDKIGIDYLVSTYYATCEKLKKEEQNKKRARFKARAKYHKYKIKYLNLIK